MTAREIADLFADLELRLIQSLKRNLRRHKDQEKAEGGKDGVPESWPAWQAEKLRSLNKFRQQNQKIVDEFSSRIDTETRTMMEEQFAEADGTEQAFFGVNADKVGALIDEMTATEAASKLEARQRRMELKVREDKRLAEGTQDPDQVKEYKAALRRDQKALRDFVNEHGDVLRRDRWRERLDVPGTVQPAAPSRISRNPDAEPLQMLRYAEDVTEEQRTSIEKELSVLPKAQREAAERQISVIRVENNPNGSNYNPKTRELTISSARERGHVIHEYGHALERTLQLEKDEVFVSIRQKGIDLADASKIVYDEDTFTEQIWRMTNDKFVSEYQGRMYESAGIYDGHTINLSSMKEYFAEGYREFYMNPENLKAHDPDLYDYIRGLLHDQE